MSDEDARRPVTVLTGFLGSGKTTLLARLLKAPEFAGTIAIINEFGEIGLDHLLIETSEERYALLDNGCVCCTVRDDLVETLLRLDARAAEGLLPDFTRVVIETTGLADPAPILHALMADERLAGAFRIDGVLTTVDAVNGYATLSAHPQAIKQAAIADRLLLTKTDLVEAGEIELLRARLARLNPTAEVISCREGDAPPAALIGAGVEAMRADASVVVDWFERAAHALERPRFLAEACDSACRDPNCSDPNCSDPLHAAIHNQGITTYSIVIDEPVSWDRFKQWLEYLAMLKGEDLLRFKGIVHVAERPERPVVVHGVQHVFHPPRELASWPNDDRRTRLVFIVRKLPRTLMETTLSKFVGISESRMHRPAA